MLPTSVLTLVLCTDSVTARFHMETTVNIPTYYHPGDLTKEAAFKAVALLWNQAYGDINRGLVQIYSEVANANKYTPEGVKVNTELLEQLIRATSSAAVVNYIKESRLHTV